jgi:hypothetical protein
MRKPTNRFAILMWVAAAAVAVINIAQIYAAVSEMAEMQARGGGTTFLVMRGFLAAITGTIAPVVMLIGFGALLEILDQIRWDARERHSNEAGSA